jgi:hypothetical protein
VKNCGFNAEHCDCPACRIYISFVIMSNYECRYVCTVFILQSHYWACDEQGYINNNWNTTHTFVNTRKAVHYKQGSCYLKWSSLNTAEILEISISTWWDTVLHKWTAKYSRQKRTINLPDVFVNMCPALGSKMRQNHER